MTTKAQAIREIESVLTDLDNVEREMLATFGTTKFDETIPVPFMTKPERNIADVLKAVDNDPTPKSWVCVDCGFNTAPGFLGRDEIKAAFALGSDATCSITWESEVYTVWPNVWQAAGMELKDGCLCIGCLEKRLGRQLRPKDFPRKNGFNLPHIPGTARLLQRQGRSAWRREHDRQITEERDR